MESEEAAEAEDSAGSERGSAAAARPQEDFCGPRPIGRRRVDGPLGLSSLQTNIPW